MGKRLKLTAESVSQIVVVKAAPARQAMQTVASIAITWREDDILVIKSRAVLDDICGRHGGANSIVDQWAEEECREDIARPCCD